MYRMCLTPGAGLACREAGGEGEEAAYEWVREYTYRVQNAEDTPPTFWFLFGEDQVTYSDLNTRLELRKRAKARKEGESEFQRPSQVLPLHQCSPRVCLCQPLQAWVPRLGCPDAEHGCLYLGAQAWVPRRGNCGTCACGNMSSVSSPWPLAFRGDTSCLNPFIAATSSLTFTARGNRSW